MKIDNIIYSKDRTAQLDLLIRSLKTNFANLNRIYVLFDYSSEEFLSGYDRVFERHPEVIFVKQERNTFSNVIKQVVNEFISTEYVLPLCDDDFMPIPTDLSEPLKHYDDNVCGINLRYHPGMCIDYLTQNQYPNPMFHLRNDVCLKWKWRNSPKGWGYPYQAGCQVYKTSQFAYMLNNSEFGLPNSMEGVICGQAPRWGREDMMCLPDQHIINISINRIQNDCNNRAGWNHSHSAADLNKLFLEGREIDMEYCSDHCKIHNKCDFIEMPLAFK